MKIGLLSDTHGRLDPQIFSFFEGCDEVWHAGDIGDIAIVDALSAFKPLQAVYGNIDGREVRDTCEEDIYFTREGLSIFLTHIAGKPPSLHPRINPALQMKKPHILVCGHTHILRVMKHQDLLYLNPGAVGYYGIHTIRTALRFDLLQGRLSNMEVIELGSRY